MMYRRVNEADDREQLAERARCILVSARSAQNLSISGFARDYAHLQSRGGSSRTAWYAWQKEPERASSLTLLAALRAIGPEMAVRAIFGEAAREDYQPRQVSYAPQAVDPVAREGNRHLEERMDRLGDFLFQAIERLGGGG
jgi:hypothetical protein